MKKFLSILPLLMLIIAASAFGTDRFVPSVYPTIQDAVTAANPGDNIIIAAGTYTITSQINLNLANLTIQGSGNESTILQVSGSGYIFLITADGITLKDLKIEKTDKLSQNIIGIQANNTTIKNNKIQGLYAFGDPETSRGLEVSSVTGLNIESNTIHSLRQPAYINAATGTIINNLVHTTRGWVIVSESNLTFSGNTWGTGAEANYYDIAIIKNSPVGNNNYTNIVGMSANNNDAVIENQYYTPPILSVVYVDKNTSTTGNNGSIKDPYKTIAEAITRAASGGKIHIAAGTYNQALTINKSLTLIGAGPVNNPTTIITNTANPIINLSVTGNSYSFQNLIIEGNITNNGIKAGSSIDINSLELKDVIGRNCQVALYMSENESGGNFLTTTINNFNFNNVTLTNNKFIGAYIGKTVISGVVTNSTFSNNGYSDESPNVWQKAGLQFVNFDISSVPHIIVSNSTFINNGAGASNIERTGLILYSAYNNLSSNDFLTVSGCNFQDHPLYAVRIRNGYRVGNTSTINGTFSNNYLDIWFSNIIGTTSSTLLVRRSFAGIRTVGTGPTFDYNTIQAAINAANSGDSVRIANGIYNESVNINKAVIVRGENRDLTIIKGPKTVAQTVSLSAGCRLENATITRDGNNTTDWVSNTNVSGVTFAQGTQNATIENVKVTENRNGIYLNNTQGNTIKNCIITNNRTGIQLVNNVSNCVIENNEITNNWTLGFVVYYAGEPTPTTNFVARYNNITGNWYGCINSKTSGANPTTSYNFAYNWYGVSTLNVNNLPAGEPGYDVQIPVQFGGTATNPGGNEGELNGDLVALINYIPYFGFVETHTITNSNLNTPVNFTSCNTSLTFTSLPPGTNSTVSIQRIESSNPPTGVPGFPRSAGNGLPLYLMITATGLTNYTFSVTVVVDVSNINGFNPNTKVMYYSTASNSWVGIQGVYSPSAKTFTFTTDHFTPFGFVNPENPNDIYLAQVVTDPVNTQKWYPAVGMGDPAPSPDWKYSNISATYYVVPTGTTGMFSSKFAVVWDKSKANLSIEAGDFWNPDQIFYSIDSSSGNNGRYWIHVASQNLNNQVPGAGKYIAKLNFTNIKPGYIPVSIDGTDFRYYYSNGDSTSGVYVTTHPGKIIFYLGDVGKTGDETMGDGRIQFEDLSLFSAAYWSINGIHAAYKYKFDIGPTNANGSYWALPTPDGKIEFEDLNIFAIGYGKTSAGQLPDNPGENKMKVSTLAGRYENGYYKVPVKVSGVVRDFRTGSFEFSYQNSELDFAGFERKGGFEGEDNFMLAKAENGKIMLDAAIVGAEKDGMNGEQVIFNLLFTEKQQGSHNIGILSARARYSSNTPIDVTIDGNGISNSEIPTVFSLEQNYPNPFNPVTTIKYGLPKDVKVSIVVYDVLGREVMTLANEYQKAGYHQVEFRGDRLASGTYFYRLIAGDFTSIKKMVLIK